MNKLSKEKRDKLLLVAIGTGGLLAVLYFLVVSPQQSALQDYADKTEIAKDKLATAERWLRMSATIQSRLEVSRKELADKQESMAPVDKFKWFYNTLDKFLNQRRVKLTDITREPEIADVGVLPKFPYQAAIFGVKLNARFHDFGMFLADFENQFPYMRVQNVEVEPESALKLAAKDTSPLDSRTSAPENLAITLRVVTLVKPNAPL
jgi:hypothetical protein